MKVEDFTFEERPLSLDGDLISWLGNLGGDDQWVVAGKQAVLIVGDHIIVWQDEPLTDEEKRDAVAEYGETVAAEMEKEEMRAGECRRERLAKRGLLARRK